MCITADGKTAVTNINEFLDENGVHNPNFPDEREFESSSENGLVKYVVRAKRALRF